MSLYYLGSFPPEYGGVTIKNRNLYQALSEHVEIKKVDFNKIKRKELNEVIHLIQAFLCKKNHFVVGIAGRKKRRQIAGLLYRLNHNAMRKSILMVMGGTLAEDLENDDKYKKYLQTYKKIYVETESLRMRLFHKGLSNVEVYPNCRFRLKKDLEVEPISRTVKCIFFSLIQPEKGVDYILEAAQELKNVEFHFYGEIVSSYYQMFLETIKNECNLYYHGCFSGSEEEKYAELRQYDILLLPTRCPTEGLPGVLIEGKIAGLAEIVTDHNYNKEIVEDGVSGIVLKENSVVQLKNAIRCLEHNNDLLAALKKGSKDSAEKYYIDKYIPDILEALDNEKK